MPRRATPPMRDSSRTTQFNHSARRTSTTTMPLIAMSVRDLEPHIARVDGCATTYRE
jgi:hypothetical protein